MTSQDEFRWKSRCNGNGLVDDRKRSMALLQPVSFSEDCSLSTTQLTSIVWCFRVPTQWPVGGVTGRMKSDRRDGPPNFRTPMSNQPTSVAAALPMSDILPLVLQYLSKDLPSLYACALVDRNSNRAASALLYRHIVFSPPWTRALDLKEARKYSVRSQYTTVVCKMDTHLHRTTACTSATGKHTVLRRTPTQCHLCKDRRNRGYDRFKIRKRRFNQTEWCSKVASRHEELP